MSPRLLAGLESEQGVIGMRPNLSVEKIAGALAVLGTSALMAACGGESKPANVPVSSTEAPAAAGDAKPADGHCGAGKEHKAGEATCGGKAEAPAAADAKPADVKAEAKPAETKTETKADAKADAKPADAKADAKPADKAGKTDAKKPAAPAPKK
jgi:hypothetical protein